MLLKPVDSWSLRSQLAFGAAILAVGATLVLSSAIAYVTLQRLRDDAGEAVRATALQMGETLSRGMFERFNDIRILAGLDQLSNAEVRVADKRQLLENLKATFPEYAWIGFTDTTGKVTASTGGLLEGADVSQRPWYIDGRFGTIVKDVHEAKLLAKLLPANPDGEPLRFVDVATPLRDTRGDKVGVLGAHMSWNWATNVRDSLLKTRGGGHGLEILVLAHNGNVLLGPDDLVGSQLDLDSFKAALGGNAGYQVETWADGKSYLTGFGPSLGFGSYPGLGWLILARQPTSVAFASVTDVRNSIILGGIVVSLSLAIAGWLAARRITRPILRIADTANEIANADEQYLNGAAIPNVVGSREVSVLGNSLQQLLGQVQQREKALRELNQSLERRVAERTESLSRANSELERENQLRRALEAELRNQAETDTLTGLYNRRAFEKFGQRELKRTQRQGSATAIVMLDIDHFKRVNDSYGHPAGDAVIRAIAETLRGNLREVDILGRLGGEEFAAMLVDCSPERAQELAERLRAAIDTAEIATDAGILRVTSSFGIASAAAADLSGTDLNQLLSTADKALYRAKSEGRNRVRMAEADNPQSDRGQSGISTARPS